jgi:hypothetical protein
MAVDCYSQGDVRVIYTNPTPFCSNFSWDVVACSNSPHDICAALNEQSDICGSTEGGCHGKGDNCDPLTNNENCSVTIENTCTMPTRDHCGTSEACNINNEQCNSKTENCSSTESCSTFEFCSSSYWYEQCGTAVGAVSDEVGGCQFSFSDVCSFSEDDDIVPIQANTINAISTSGSNKNISGSASKNFDVNIDFDTGANIDFNS